jgi:hypothetical protein
VIPDAAFVKYVSSSSKNKAFQAELKAFFPTAQTSSATNLVLLM